MAKEHVRMPMTQRAKQFMPFSALKGLSEALAERLKIKVPKRELAEDGAAELNLKLRCLKKGTAVKVVYYDSEERCYVEKTGMVSKVDETFRNLIIVDTAIKFTDIYDIEIE